MRCTSLRKASIDHGLAIVAITLSLPQNFVTSETITIPRNSTEENTYRRRGL